MDELDCSSTANYLEPGTSDDEELRSAAVSEIIELDWNTLINEIDLCMKKLDWSIEDGQNYLQSKYGVRSRHHLSDEEIIEFMRYLQDQLK